MKIILFYLLFLCSINVYSQPFSKQWEEIFHGILENSYFQVNDATSDNNNNFYIVGQKDTSLSSKLFLNKYFPDGSIGFEIEYYEPYKNWIRGTAVYCDANNNIYTAGWKVNNDSIFLIILKFDTLGNLIWNFQKPATMDGSNTNRFDIKLTSDSSGSLYYAIYNFDFGNNFYTLKCGRLNANGSQVWENYLPKNFTELLSFKIRKDNKLETIISGSYDSVLVQLHDANFNTIASLAKRYMYGRAAYVDENDNTYFSAQHIDTVTWTQDSDVVVKLDPQLNEKWILYNEQIGGTEILTGSGPYLYWLASINLYRIDTSGVIIWSEPTYSYVESVLINHKGDAYVSFSSSGSHTSACFQIYDSSGNFGQPRCFMDYIYPKSALNNNSGFISGMWQASGQHYGNQVVYFDSSFTDSTSYINITYQHKLAYDWKSLVDRNHNIIDFCRMADTIVHSGYYSFPGFAVSKFDSSGNFLWRNKFTLTSYGYYNFKNAFADSKNNVYAYGQTPGPPNYTQAGFLIKVSEDGMHAYQYFYFDSAVNAQYSINSVIADSAGNVYIAGIADTSTSPNYDTDAILMKLDSTLNPIWIKRININPAVYESADNIQLYNQHLIFTVRSVVSGSYYNYICESDTSGNLISTLPVNNAFNPYTTIMKVDHSGNYVLAGLSFPPAWYLTKMDHNGTILCEWNDTLGNIDWLNAVADIIVDPNDDIYILGQTSNNNSGNYRLRKFNNCNVLWEDSIQGSLGSTISSFNNRIYTSAKSVQSELAPITIYDSAGTILYRDSIPCFSGYPSTIVPDTNAFYTSTTIRTDTMGAQIDIRRYIDLFPTRTKEVLRRSIVYVYPNPATNFLRIHSDQNKISRIELFDIAGRLIYSDNLESKNHNYIIYPQKSLTGLFFYKIYNEDKNIATGKITFIH